jgi:hypothetical protein
MGGYARKLYFDQEGNYIRTYEKFKINENEVNTHSTRRYYYLNVGGSFESICICTDYNAMDTLLGL